MGSIREDVRKLSRELRHQMTPEEVTLWSALRRKAMGCRFRRQHPYANFIFDFYCPHARLAVELDGAYHDEGRDSVRDAHCAAAGISTLRFSNARLRCDLNGVLREIRLAVELRGSRSERPAGVCPPERLGEHAVEVRDERQDLLLECLDGEEVTALENASGEDAEPDLDLVQPRAVLGREDEANPA